MMLTEMKSEFKFSGLYPLRENSYGQKTLEEFVWEEDTLPCNHAPVVFHSNSCNFASFPTAIKSLPFGLRA